MSVTYLPVYSLAEMTSPVDDDYFVMQSSATNGDVALLSITNFLDAFLTEYMEGSTIDASTISLYTSMGWTAP